MTLAGRTRAVPGDLRPARDQPGPGPRAVGPARRLLPAARGRRRGADRHRDRVGAPVRLALRARPAGRGLRGRAGARSPRPAARTARWCWPGSATPGGRARRPTPSRVLWAPSGFADVVSRETADGDGGAGDRRGGRRLRRGRAAGRRSGPGRRRDRRRARLAAAPVPVRADQPARRRVRHGPAAADPRGAGARCAPRSARAGSWRCGCPATSWPRGPASPRSRPPSTAAALARTVDLLAVVRGGPYSAAPTGRTPTPRRRSTWTCAAAIRGRRWPARSRSSCRAAWSTPARPQAALDDGRRRPGRDDPGPDRRPRPGGQAARAAQPDRIRPCILCNQTCRVRDNRNPVVTCVGEPRSGHETADPPAAADGAAGPEGPEPARTGQPACWSSAAGRPGSRRPGSLPGRGWRSGWPSGGAAGRHPAGRGGRPGPRAAGPSGRLAGGRGPAPRCAVRPGGRDHRRPTWTRPRRRARRWSWPPGPGRSPGSTRGQRGRPGRPVRRAAGRARPGSSGCRTGRSWCTTRSAGPVGVGGGRVAGRGRAAGRRSSPRTRSPARCCR